MSSVQLAPFGHITWTANLGGAIFASAWQSGRFRLDRRVGWTLVGVIVLHALWDASYGMAIRAGEWPAGDGLDLRWPNTAAWSAPPPATSSGSSPPAYDTLLGILAIIGGIWAIRRWRAYEIHRWTSADPRPDAVAEKHAMA